MTSDVEKQERIDPVGGRAVVVQIELPDRMETVYSAGQPRPHGIGFRINAGKKLFRLDIHRLELFVKETDQRRHQVMLRLEQELFRDRPLQFEVASGVHGRVEKADQETVARGRIHEIAVRDLRREKAGPPARG